MDGSDVLAYADLICHAHAMKACLTILVLVSFLFPAFAAAPSSKGRKITELNVIPLRVLQRSISPKFYKSLTISPVDGWIVVRASLVGTHLSGARIVRSALGGEWDALALQRASEVIIAGNYSIAEPNRGTSVLLHLLVYKIADGMMALSFAHLDEPGGNQADYFGCARLAVVPTSGWKPRRKAASSCSRASAASASAFGAVATSPKCAPIAR